MKFAVGADKVFTLFVLFLECVKLAFVMQVCVSLEADVYLISFKFPNKYLCKKFLVHSHFNFRGHLWTFVALAIDTLIKCLLHVA